MRPHHPFEGQSLSVLGSIQKRGRLYLILILPDESRSHIPAAWTDLFPIPPDQKTEPVAVLGSMDDFLRARIIVDALQRGLNHNLPLPSPPTPVGRCGEESGSPAVAAPQLAGRRKQSHP